MAEKIILTQFLLRGLIWAILHASTQNHLQNVGTCPGLSLQLLARNNFFQSDSSELKIVRKVRKRLVARKCAGNGLK